jgi:aspartate/methionine/tyrosine aminotransferase
MKELNPLATELNQIIEQESSTVMSLLSRKGRRIFFPSKGILAQGMAAKGKAINATLGEAYTDTGAPLVLNTLSQHLQINPKEAFPYAPSFGLMALRQRWQTLQKEKNPTLLKKGAEFSLPVVSCGLTHGLYSLAYLFCDEGDEIICPDLYWDNYELIFDNGFDASLKTFPLFDKGGFNLDAFQSVLMDGPTGKRIVLLNFPNNPSGYTPNRAEAAAIVAILEKAAQAGNRLLVILDDAYFGLAFEDDVMPESLFSSLIDLHPNILTAKVDGVTKEEYAWGFRVGFITYGIQNGRPPLYAALEAKTGGAVRGCISNAPHLSQSLVLKALQDPAYVGEKKANAAKIAERYETVKKIIHDRPEFSQFFSPLPFNSGYFMCLRLHHHQAENIRQILLTQYDTGLIAFPDKGLLRIAFSSLAADKMAQLYENIYQACSGSHPS